MGRLPQPGADNGNWGDILNDYLRQSHDEAGKLKTDSVGTEQIKAQSVTTNTLADGLITASKIATGLISPVGLSGNYVDLTSKPVIPANAVDVGAEPAGLSTATKAQLVVKQGTRTAIAPLSAPNGLLAAVALDHTQRTMFKLPFAAPRWRIKFRNQSNRLAIPYTTPCTITGVWTGAPVRVAATSTTGSELTTTTSGRWAGNCVGALTQVVTAPITVPVDGSWAYSSWVVNDSFGVNVEKVISWGITSTATGTGIASGNSYQGVVATGAAQASNATLTSPTIGTNSIRLDVVLEYEFAESVQTILFVGDSNTLTYVPNAPAGFSANYAGALPHESWPMIAGAMGGFAAVNIGVGSTTLGDWSVSFPSLLDKIPAAMPIDAAIISLGTNGLSTGLSGFLVHFSNLNAKIRALGIDSLWWTTITARGYPDGAYTSGGTIITGNLLTNAAASATTLSCSFSPAIGKLLVGTGPNMEDVTVSGVSGTGPYIVTISSLANAHYTNERVSVGDERTRTLINNFIRNGPDGIVGIFDFEKLLELNPGAWTNDPRYTASDYLHFSRNASVVKAGLVVGAGVQPLFGSN